MLSSTGPHRSGYHHRKRLSVTRLSSDTTSTLPEYVSPTFTDDSLWTATTFHIPSENPPGYPDSANEADEETEDDAPISPLISPRRHRRARFGQKSLKNSYSGLASASDTYLDSLLERSVNALEMSNNLLQSSMSTHSSLSNVFGTDSKADQLLESRAKALTFQARQNRQVQKGWMDDLDEVTKSVEHLFGDHRAGEQIVSQSLPTYGLSIPHPKSVRRKSAGTHRSLSYQSTNSNGSRSKGFQKATPHTLAQSAELKNELDSASDASSNSKFLRQSSMHMKSGLQELNLQNFHHGQSFSSQSLCDDNVSSRRTISSSRSSSASSTIRSRGRSSSLQRSQSQSSSRSRSRTVMCNPSTIPYQLPPTILELSSQSESSTSSSSEHLFRTTVESLKKILHDQHFISDPKGKKPEKGLRSPTFQPRSSPVAPIVSISSTTTSISRLLTKGSHSTSTRAPPPPKLSSLKQKIPSSSSGADLRSSQSTISSGRSTPRQVAFGPLPESYANSKGGSSAKFKDKKKSKRGLQVKKEADGNESSWWRIWLTGGSGLTMGVERHEERIEDRAARSWGRPGMGTGLEDWAI